MLYPQKGSIANGSRRKLPTAPVAAAVVSEAMIDPRNTPWRHENASCTSGTTEPRRPPKRIAEIGTPAGSSHSLAIAGSCAAATVNREFGCAAGLLDAGVQSLPSQSIRCDGGSLVRPSHQTSPSSVSAVFVKIVFACSVSTAFGFVSVFVPGATPKKPASGLIARSVPSGPIFIQQMSSPIVSTFQSGIDGMSMARFVFPQADGKAPVT